MTAANSGILKNECVCGLACVSLILVVIINSNLRLTDTEEETCKVNPGSMESARGLSMFNRHLSEFESKSDFQKCFDPLSKVFLRPLLKVRECFCFLCSKGSSLRTSLAEQWYG